MREIRRKLNDHFWTFRLVTEKEMEKESEGAAGLTIVKSRLILIDETSVDHHVVAHELYHAYFSDLYLEDTDGLTLQQIEEIAANLFADKGSLMVKRAKKITKDLQELLEKEKK